MNIRPTQAVMRLEEYHVTSQDVWRMDDPGNTLKLDWNESPVVHDLVRDRLKAFLQRPGAVNWYPDVAAMDLTKAIARFLQVSPMQVLAFGGSDVALETVARTYIEPGDPVAIIHPGYDNFRVYAEGCGAVIHRLGAGPEVTRFDFAAFLAGARAMPKPKMLYLINPNNPVGYLVPRDQITALLRAFPETAVIIDEAYIEFAPSAGSSASLVAEFPNLFVFRSFSKAFGMAGLRLGYVVSDHANLAHVRKLRNGKNLTMFAQIAGLTLLEHPDIVRRHVERIKEGRELFQNTFRKMGGTVLDSHANFGLVKVPQPQDVIFRLKAEGIYVRDRSSMKGLEGMFRLTYAAPETMERVLRAFREMPPALWRATLETSPAGE